MSGLQVAMQRPLPVLPMGPAWLLRAGLLLLVACMLLPLLRGSVGAKTEIALTAVAIVLLTLFGVVYLACFLPWILQPAELLVDRPAAGGIRLLAPRQPLVGRD